MGVGRKTLDDCEFGEWTLRTAELVRSGRLSELDLEHIAEEIEDLGKLDRASVESLLFRILLHQVKRRIQPERDGASWRKSIVTSQPVIDRKIQDAPSLRQFLLEELPSIYAKAVRGAECETGVRAPELPEQCSFALN